mmetsp:Transcript_25324/g.56279  ORF Transcript_25324/g.56279 Transcript_25324/m.56279 type:complete len:889 (+) Transcript_25324:3-2669(+)
MRSIQEESDRVDGVGGNGTGRHPWPCDPTAVDYAPKGGRAKTRSASVDENVAAPAPADHPRKLRVARSFDVEGSTCGKRPQGLAAHSGAQNGVGNARSFDNAYPSHLRHTLHYSGRGLYAVHERQDGPPRHDQQNLPVHRDQQLIEEAQQILSPYLKKQEAAEGMSPPPPPPPPLSSSSAATSASTTSLPSTSSAAAPLHSLLTEVYENEVYSSEDGTWSASSPGDGSGSVDGSVGRDGSSSTPSSRWTHPNTNQPSPAPTAIVPPPGYEFADEWKIDVTSTSSSSSSSAASHSGGSTRDEWGWEYYWDYGTGVGRRRRRWLRKLRPAIVATRDAAEVLLGEQQGRRREEVVEDDGEEVEVDSREASGRKTIDQQDEVVLAVEKSDIDTAEENVEEKVAAKKKPKKEEARVEDKSSTQPTTTSSSSSNTKHPRQSSSSIKRRSRPTTTPTQLLSRTILRPLRDNWNFKGYGLSIMKSLTFPTSGGISLRLPLTINLDWYERHPELPSLSSSASYYYSNTNPWTYAVFLNASLPMELIRFCVRRFGEYGWFLAGVLWSTLLLISDAVWTVLIWPVTVLGRFGSLLSDMALNDGLTNNRSGKSNKSKTKKNSRKKKRNQRKKKNNKDATDDTVIILGQSFPRLPGPRGIVYSTSIQDRVGVSASWRVSARRGYEFRISYWHLFLPTLLALASFAGKTAKLLVVSSSEREKGRVPMKGRVGGDLDEIEDDDDEPSTVKARVDLWHRIAEPCEEWITRRTGSLGISWGGPIPDSPFWSASAVLSLSGFYPREVADELRKSMSLLSLRRARQYYDDGLGDGDVPLSEARMDSIIPSESLSPAEIEEVADNNEETFDISDSEEIEDTNSKLMAAAAADDSGSSSDEADMASVTA